MNKIIHAFRLSMPDVSGYPDKVQILNSDTGDMLVYECNRFSTNPNPMNPHNGQSWRDSYTQIAPVTCKWSCIDSQKHGVCIALNGLGPVPTIAPDPNNHGRYEALDVEVHCGYSKTWRGSMACQTVHPDDWQTFIGHFLLGETGIFILTDETNKQFNKEGIC
jgi:hypothetical protein